jgi:ribosomal protein L29
MRIKDVRHEIARILTIMSERASERRNEAPGAEVEAS